MNISDVLKVRKKAEDTGYIIPIVEEQIIVDAMKSTRSRRKDVFHPSELCFGTFCSREWIFCQRDPVLNEKRKVSIEQQRRFDVGHVLHSYMQEKLGNSGYLFGVWECLRRCKGESCINLGFKPKKEVCNDALWVYKEPTVHDEDLHIYGNVDGIVIKPPYKYGFEFKSTKSDAFNTMVSPLYNHKEQAFWYLDLLSRNHFKQWNDLCKVEGVDDIIEELKPYIEKPFDGAVVVYQNKDTQEFREFFVPAKFSKDGSFMIPDDEDLHYIIEQKKKTLRKALEHLEKGTLPERLYQCDDKSARRAKICSASKPCFEEE